ncbi:MAG: hypothetical protein N3F09_07800 [Bacteroidia bacterium]|nr:hypothetical protein [Bacteroidia bacterium]
MENEVNLSPQESLQIIEQTIQRARNRFADISVYFILWGWLVFLACMLNYAFIALGLNDIAHSVWWLMPLGGILSGIIGYKQGNKSAEAKSYIDNYVIGIWVGFLIMLVLCFFISIKFGMETGYFLLIAAMSWGTFCTGFIIQFRHMIIAGIAGFILSAISIYISFPEKQILLALAMICVYIVPGYLLKHKLKNQSA